MWRSWTGLRGVEWGAADPSTRGARSEQVLRLGSVDEVNRLGVAGDPMPFGDAAHPVGFLSASYNGNVPQASRGAFNARSIFNTAYQIGARGFGPKASEPAQRAQLHPGSPAPEALRSDAQSR